MKKRGRPTILTPALQRRIAECFWLAFTDEQTALYCDIDRKTIFRIRTDDRFCPIVKRSELRREAVFRRRIWNGHERWQGAAWFLERKYPTQFARPEIQLAVTNQIATGPTNIVILAPEAASVIAGRMHEIETELLPLTNGNDNQEKETNGSSH